MMPGTRDEFDDDFDAQDQAEAFDEDNLLGAGGAGEDRSFADSTTFEELSDLEDYTRADGDRDEDEALALDAADFDPDAIDDGDLEDDDELAYRAATDEHEDDLDGLGEEDSLAAVALSPREIEGLDEVRDAAEAEGGEDDVTNLQSRGLSDADLKAMGYAEPRSRGRPKPGG